MSYKIFHHKLFEKEILKVPSHHQRKIYRLLTTGFKTRSQEPAVRRQNEPGRQVLKQVLISLKEKPTSLPPNTSPLTGFKNTYRTRIGSIRLIYQISHSRKMIFVLGVNPRGSVYRLIKRMLG